MKRILVVDDSKTILYGIKSCLEESTNIQVFMAKSYKECADIILKEKGKFDLALLDYNLPDASKGEIVNLVSKFNIKSILLTATELELNNEIFKNKFIVDYVIKDGSQAIEYASQLVNRILYNEKVKVLIIDDSKTFAHKMEELCQKYNLQTAVRYSGEEGLNVVDEQANIKIILVDYMMPDMNGLEFTSKLRKKYKKNEIAIIALSGSADKALVAKFLKFGANDFLYKDFSEEEFFSRINNTLEIMNLFEIVNDKAIKDYMTGMFNRRYFFSTGSEIYKRALIRKEHFAVAMIDIDKFKNINDTYGHDVGDIAIKEVAKILSTYLNENSLIARMGGEEFCVIITNRPEAEVIQTFEEIREAFEKNVINIDNLNLKYTVSIGLCTNLDPGECLEDMVKFSDLALYEAKENGRNNVNMYKGIF